MPCSGSVNTFLSISAKLVFFHPSTSKKEIAKISISDLTGKNIFSKSVSTVSKLQIATDDFAKGVYLLKVEKDGKTSNQKLVIQ